ncbi:MAG: hypothetical protein JO048_08125 [Methylobacteriaceae bacterium]|nr:hypothetical protein [Methylobacteriaceae bacterium]
MTAPVRLFIGTPTAEGIAMTGFVESLAAMLLRLAGRGVPTVFRALDGESHALQLNLLAHAFLASDATHLLILDSDLVFPPDLAERLLAADKPVIGVPYAKRRLDLAALTRRLADAPFDDALALALDWNLQPLETGLSVARGLAEVAAVPSGFLLVARPAFELMRGRPDVLRLPGPPAAAPLTFFRETVRDGALIHVDYAFCHRYRESGGEVWAFLDADVRHIGEDRTAPSYAALLAAVGPDPAAALA